MMDPTVRMKKITGADPSGFSDLLHALQAVRDGDFSVRLPGDRTGIEGKIADTFNEIVTVNGRVAGELRRVAHGVGKKGKTRLRGRIGRGIRARWGGGGRK